MGCYLSAPDDRVYVTEGVGKGFRYATASCQGWRREQEDAEDCLPYFDDDASLFILCDGHGGAEVAKYTVKNFPYFLKNHQKYKEGRYAEALEDAFIEFDQLLRTDEALKELERLAMDGDENGHENQAVLSNENHSNNKNASGEDAEMDIKEDEPSASSSIKDANSIAGGSGASVGSSTGPSTSAGPSSTNGPSSVAEDVDSETLRREAHIPIEELINKYTGSAYIKGRVQSLRHKPRMISGSPVIRSSQKNGGDDEIDDDTDVQGSSNSIKKEDGDSNNQPGPSAQNSDRPSSSSGSRPALEIIRKAMGQYFKDGDEDDEDDEDDSEFEVSGLDDDYDEEDDDDDDDEESEEDDDEENEEDGDDDDDDDPDDSDGANDNEDGDDESEDAAAFIEKLKSKRLRKKHRRLALDNSSSSGSDKDECDEDSEGDDEELDNSMDEKGYADFKKKFPFLVLPSESETRVHKPGVDSGCTVVVALLKEGTLYVASAGDSRCILITSQGRCRPMSFDHKPEDELESGRIFEANGEIVDGRVNGGLNLSRAFGDFSYKDVNLDPRKQMITPLPDVKSYPISGFEYIFLACDGIWNSMSNDKVAKFICHYQHNLNLDLVDTCMSLFRTCLAPNTDGDGTGCDNMTCILVKYNKDDQKIEDSQITEQSDLKSVTADDSQTNDTHSENNHENSNELNSKEVVSSTSKRAADGTDHEIDDRPSCKRRCFRLLEE